MSNLGDQIRARLDLRAKKVLVPAWGTDEEPVELYFFPLTVNGAKKLNDYVGKKGSSKREDEYVYFLIFNAMDEQGEKAFDLDDVEWLSNQPLNLIVDIYLQANNSDGFEETLKK